MRRLAFVVVALLVGCGSSHSQRAPIASTAPASTAAPAPTSTTPTVTGTPIVVQPSSGPVYAVSFQTLSATEFAGGWGKPPPFPATPPPPTLTVSATFANRGIVDLNSTDPSVGLLVTFTDTATGAPIQSQVFPLSASLASQSKANEVVMFTLKTTYQQVWVTTTLVRIDPATGKVVSNLSAPTTVAVSPPITYPI